MTAEQIAPQERMLTGELEHLLEQLERSTTHYEAMGLRRSATAEDVKQAYLHAVMLLNPAHHSEDEPDSANNESNPCAAFSTGQVSRIDQAFDRISLAFSVLANASKRAEYDRFMLARASGLPGEIEQSRNRRNEAFDAGANAVGSSNDKTHNEAAPRRARYDKPAIVSEEDNRRRTQRFGLIVPALVCGYDRKSGKWEEMAETINVSRTGVRLRLRRRVRHGTIVHLALPLPVKLRNHGFSDPTYGVYALVRRVEPSKKGVRVIGVEFIGEQPPKGYQDKPWAVFQTKTWAGQDRRRKPRRDCSEIVWLEYFNEAMQCIRQEAGRAENISKGGARLSVKQAPAEFELLRLGYPDRGTETFAVVCSRYFGKDGYERLCLRFVEATDLVARDREEIVCDADTATAEKRNARTAKIEQSITQPLTKTDQLPQVEAMKFEPQKEDKQRLQKTAESKAVTVREKARSGKILVADDDPPLRRVLGKILASAGYDVIVVEDGKAAVEKARVERPDLVITDGLMPKMHGFLVCKTIKQMPAPPKVIMLTAVYTKMQYKWEAKEKYGADELLTKPFEVAELLECVERMLSNSPRAEAVPA